MRTETRDEHAELCRALSPGSPSCSERPGLLRRNFPGPASGVGGNTRRNWGTLRPEHPRPRAPEEEGHCGRGPRFRRLPLKWRPRRWRRWRCLRGRSPSLRREPAGPAWGVRARMATPDHKSPNVLLQSLCCRILGRSEGSGAGRAWGPRRGPEAGEGGGLRGAAASGAGRAIGPAAVRPAGASASPGSLGEEARVGRGGVLPTVTRRGFLL